MMYNILGLASRVSAFVLTTETTVPTTTALAHTNQAVRLPRLLTLRPDYLTWQTMLPDFSVT